jgi:protein gp37
MQTTSIEWTNHTWNIATGCDKVDKDCLNCYMYRESYDGTRYDPNTVTRTKTVFKKPLKIKGAGELVFTSSLTDIFHPGVDPFRNEMWDIIRARPDLTFQLLTKRPERIIEHLPDDWGDGWPNVWLGTSIGSQGGFEKRFEYITTVPAKVRFISFEPLWERILFSSFVDISSALRIDWAIIGGESGAVWNGKGKRPKYVARKCELGWIEQLKTDLHSYGIPVFVKQVGSVLAKEMGMSDNHGRNFSEFPESIKCREFPHYWRDLQNKI